MALGDNKEVVDSFQMLQENLKAVDVALADSTYALGPKLQFNAKAERFVGNEHANQLLTRPYREPFVVPTQV
jgi:hypothetical protein